MFPSSWLNLLLYDENSNPKSDIRCPLCGEQYRICRNGHYWRYRYEGNDRVAVQRYGCRNPGCPRKTFSIPPHPLLPLCRIPLCLLMVVLKKHRAEGCTVSRCARWLKRSWNTARRALKTATRLLGLVHSRSRHRRLPDHTLPSLGLACFYPGLFVRFFPRTKVIKLHQHKSSIA